MRLRAVAAGGRDPVAQPDRAAALRFVHLIAVAGTVLMLVVVAASAFLRLAHAAAACPDWPSCAEAPDAIPIAVAIARTAHRLTASAIAILLIALLVIARAQRPRLAAQASLAATGLAIALGLALLGMQMRHAAAGSAPPAVNLANLAGGFALLAIMATSWAASRAPSSAPPTAARLRMLCIASLAAAALAVVSGGLASSDVARMRTMHLAMGFVTVLLVGVLLLALRRAPAPLRRWGAPVTVLWLAQPALGLVQVYAPPSVAVALAHNIAAASLVATLAAATYRSFAGSHVHPPA